MLKPSTLTTGTMIVRLFSTTLRARESDVWFSSRS